jgi:hypothetical protein
LGKASMERTVAGRRITANTESHLLKPGDYGRRQNGTWIVCTPNGLSGSLSNHTVTEHEDGTITVAPSILISGWNYPESRNKETYHGFLEKGIWKEV